MPKKLFQKGHEKLGGRTQGTVNKYTQELKEAVLHAINDPKYIQKLKDARPELLVSLAKAMLPKDVNIGGQPDNELLIKIAGKYGN